MIPEKDIAILQRVGAVASELGLDCYAVGGYVRDCFLKRHSKDIDFVTVGSGIDLASAVRPDAWQGCASGGVQKFWYGTGQMA